MSKRSTADGRVLVFGSSGGIGRAVVRKLLEDGYEVFRPSRETCDLSSEASLTSFLGSIPTEIESVIYCAGYNLPKPVEETTELDMQYALQVNALAAFQIFRFFIPHQRRLGGGSNVLVSSAYASRSVAGRVAYSTSKAAAELLTRGMAVELGPDRIRYNVVRPGFIDTPMTSRNNSPTQVERLRKRIPFGELGTAEDVANLISFLVGPTSSYISGGTFGVDGGYGAT